VSTGHDPSGAQYLMIVTAVGEGGAGLVLLVLPAVPVALLFGVDQASPETSFVGRIAGAALLALGVACWPGRGTVTIVPDGRA